MNKTKYDNACTSIRKQHRNSYLACTTTMSKNTASSSVMLVLLCRAAVFNSHKADTGDNNIPNGYELTTSQLELFVCSFRQTSSVGYQCLMMYLRGAKPSASIAKGLRIRKTTSARYIQLNGPLRANQKKKTVKVPSTVTRLSLPGFAPV